MDEEYTYDDLTSDDIELLHQQISERETGEDEYGFRSKDYA